MSKKQEILIELVGIASDAGMVRFSDFNKFCRSLSNCLRNVAEIVDAKNTQYRITKLEASSATIVLEPFGPDAADGKPEMVAELFRATVSNLQGGQDVDQRFNKDDLRTFRELVEPVNQNRLSSVRIDGTVLTYSFDATIDRIIGTTIPSEGTVTGRLEGLLLHDTREFYLYPPITGYRIRCQFEESLYEDVYGAMRKTVTVSGTLHFRPGKPFPDVVQAKKIDVHPADDDLPTLAELRGISPECTGPMTAVAFVRALRDEQEKNAV